MAAVEAISDMFLATGVQVGREVFSGVQVFYSSVNREVVPSSSPVLFPRGGGSRTCVDGRGRREAGGYVDEAGEEARVPLEEERGLHPTVPMRFMHIRSKSIRSAWARGFRRAARMHGSQK